MSASHDEGFGVMAERLTIGSGLTAVISPIPGQNGFRLRYVSGGSLAIFGMSTSSGCSFATSNLYTMTTTEVLDLKVSGPVTLFCAGVTTICDLLRTRAILDPDVR